jgi:hypothetical protein
VAAGLKVPATSTSMIMLSRRRTSPPYYSG